MQVVINRSARPSSRQKSNRHGALLRALCRGGPAIVILFLLLARAAAADPVSACAAALPWGLPQNPTLATTLPVCHAHETGGYAAFVDPRLKVPRLVVYRLDRAHTVGCNPRPRSFHAELDLPPEARATASDYKDSGYQLGHMAPNKDFAWDEHAQHDSFSMANVAPQLAGLNTQQWEHLEETVRAWAWMRGVVIVYVGPELGTAPGTVLQGIGAHRVAVPTGFWKIVADPRTGEMIGFAMPQQPIPKGDLSPWQVPLNGIWNVSHMILPGTGPTPAQDRGALWPADLAGYNRVARAACPH